MDKFWSFVAISAEYTSNYWASIYIREAALQKYYNEKALRYEGFLMGMIYAFDIDAPSHQELAMRIVRDAFPDLFISFRKSPLCWG